MMTPSERTAVHVSCRAILAEKSKSFHLASRLLPRAVRDDVAVLYAWCRYVDDAVDEAPSPAAAGAALGRLREELEAAYAGQPQPVPLQQAFADLVARRQLPRAYAEALLDGMAMDVEGTRYDELATLWLYCYRVAGVVGLMMCHVLGVASAAARAHAAQLGMAMQLTNICRDVAEDWQRGRRYLPAGVLRAHGAEWLLRAPLGQPLAPTTLSVPERRGLARAVAALLAEAERFYVAARPGPRALQWRVALGVRTAAAVYRAIGVVVRHRGYDVFAGRAVVRKGTKLWLVGRSLGRLLLEMPQRLLSPFRPVPLVDALAFPKDVMP